MAPPKKHSTDDEFDDIADVLTSRKDTTRYVKDETYGRLLEYIKSMQNRCEKRVKEERKRRTPYEKFRDKWHTWL